LALFLLLIISGCYFIASSEEDEALRKTRVALYVQQTLVADKAQESSERTVTAQYATIATNAAAQTAHAGIANTPNLEATQMALSAQGTIAEAEAASVAQETSAAATQIALAAQGTAVVASQAALSAKQTLAASGSTPGAPPVTSHPVAGPGRPPPGSQLFDDFSDHTSWPVTSQADYSTVYDIQDGNSIYFIIVHTPHTDAWAVAGWYAADV
jgi:hypothetical protein